MNTKQYKIAEQIVNLLTQNNCKVCSAESCSGGGIAKALTSVPGCSEVFAGGVVAYSNAIKVRLLSVPEKMIEKCGAVSEKVVIEMADNTARVFDADFCIASTGIAGPSGGTMKKPIGTVWLAVATPKNIIILENLFKGNRERIREQTITHGLELLKNEILNYLNSAD